MTTAQSVRALPTLFFILMTTTATLGLMTKVEAQSPCDPRISQCK
jgi:hypothetical protein